MSNLVKAPVFDQFGNCLVVSRDSAETLLAMLGCVNTDKWDTDFIVRALRRISMLKGVQRVDPSYQHLLDAIDKVGRTGVVVIRSDRRPITTPVALVDRTFTKSNAKRHKKKRVRGETFSFEKCGIPIGATLQLKRDPSITCTVVGDPWIVDFDDGVMKSFTERTRDLLGSKDSTYLSPMHYWLYDGKLLRFYYRNVQCKNSKKSKKKESTKV